MAEQHKHPNYWAIWAVLLVLTILEVLVARLPHWIDDTRQVWATTITVLVLLAFVKAACVALFFMHLKFERKLFVVIVCAPLFLAAVLVLALLPDVGFAAGG